MTFRSRVIGVVSALVLMATACGGGAATEVGDTASDQVASTDASTASGAATTEADAATGPDLGLLGQGSLEGQDVVVWFWAEW